MKGDLEKLTKLHLDIIDEHIIFLDSECKVLHLNKAAKKQFKMGRKGLIGNDCSSYCKFRDYNINDCTANIAKKTKKKQSAEIKIEDGSIFQVVVYPIIENKKVNGYIEISTDITEKKKAGEELIESEEKYRNLFNNANDAIFLIDFSNPKRPGKFLDVNDVCCQKYGYSREELLQMSPKDITVSDYHSEIPGITKKLSIDEQITFEMKHINKNGRTFSVEISSHVFVLDDENVILSIVRDITNKKKAEEELIKSEEKYRTLIETMNEGLAIIDKNNVINFTNLKLPEMLGLSFEELNGKKITDFYTEESHQVLRELTKRKRDEMSDKFELSLRRKDGSIINVIVSPRPIFNDEDEFTGSLGVFTDITEMKSAQEALEESEKKYRTLIETMNDGLVVIDENNLFTFINLKFQEMLGYDDDYLIGRLVSDFHTKESREIFNEQIKMRRKGHDERFEASFIRKDGIVIDTLISPKPLFDYQGKYIGSFAVITDITEMKKVVQEHIKSGTLYRTIFEVSGTANVIIDENNLIKLVNSKMEELTGYTKDELLGRMLEYQLDPEEIIEKLIIPSIDRRKRQSQEHTVFESKMLDKQGNVHNILSYIALIPETKDTITSILDITELKKAEDIRRMAYDQIINNIQEFANLIDGIRNPLSVIQGAIDLGLDSWKDVINTQIRKIESIAEQIDLRWVESDQFRNTLVEQLQ